MSRATAVGMGGITATVIADSLHPVGDCRRLITLQLRYPRFIHAEFMTHRVFSRNASSSRAIPVAKMLEQVRNDPAMPIHWGKNQPGMQARGELTGKALAEVQQHWRNAATQASHQAEQMADLGTHKQVVNRILEPFQFINVIVTATEWSNFFELRDHQDAQPEICELAIVMKQAMAASEPERLTFGEWHLPYVTTEEVQDYGIQTARKLSAARCARVSYNNHDGSSPVVQKDIELFEALVGGVPLHASPIEHQAMPDPAVGDLTFGDNSHLWGNFVHWVQFRKLHEQLIHNQAAVAAAS